MICTINYVKQTQQKKSLQKEPSLPEKFTFSHYLLSPVLLRTRRFKTFFVKNILVAFSFHESEWGLGLSTCSDP